MDPHRPTEGAKLIENGRSTGPTSPAHSAALYIKRQDLLSNLEVKSVAYRAHGDYQTISMMASEQRKRADSQGRAAAEAFHLSALINLQVEAGLWDAQFDFYDEGIGYGDLFIDGGGLGEGKLRYMMVSRTTSRDNFY